MVMIANVVLLSSALASAPEAPTASRAGRVTDLVGGCWVTRGENKDPVTGGGVVREGDILSTDEDGRLALLMRDKTLLSLGPKSRVTIRTYEVEAKTRRRKASLKVWLGRLWARVSKSIQGEVTYRVETVNAVAGVRGTEFVVDVQPDGETQVVVLEGEVEVGGIEAEVTELLGAMQRGAVRRGGQVEVSSVSANEASALAKAIRTRAAPSKGATSESSTLRPKGAAKTDKSNDANSNKRSDTRQENRETNKSSSTDDTGRGERGENRVPEDQQDSQRERPQHDDRDPVAPERQEGPQAPDTPIDLEPSPGHGRVRGRIEVQP